MTNTALVQIAVLDVTPVQKGRLVAIASAEIAVDGIAFIIHGIQIVSIPKAVQGKDAIAVDLPRYRDASGIWRQAIDLPVELRSPLGDAVLERCAELNLTRRADN